PSPWRSTAGCPSAHGCKTPESNRGATPSNGQASGIASSGALDGVERGVNAPNRQCASRDVDLARLRGCPGKPGAGNPHAGFSLGGEAQGQPRLLPTDHTIPKSPLLARVAEKVSDGTLLDLLQRFLDQEILEGMQQWTPLAGVPQGSVLSPLLSNLYLHPLDRVVAQAGYQMVRYCDDLVLLCRTQAEAEAALALVQDWTWQHGLRL